MAYYGPNAEILGNVKLTLWHYHAVTDLKSYLQNIILLFFVDLSSAIIVGIILWTMCKINILKTLQSIQKDLWHLLAIAETLGTLLVNMNNIDTDNQHILCTTYLQSHEISKFFHLELCPKFYWNWR